MKITFNRDSMLSAAQLMSGAVPAKDVKPVLRNLKCVAEEKRLTLMATDLEIGIRLEVLGVEVETPGECLLPPKFLNILRESTDAVMSLTVGEKIVLKGPHGKFELPVEAVSDFPPIPEFDADSSMEINGEDFKTAVERTVFVCEAVNSGNVRISATSGLLLEPGEGSIAMVGARGSGLAKMAVPASGEGVGTVLPIKAVTLASKVLVPSETILACLRGKDAMFKTGRATIHTLAIEGRFPNYNNVIPKDLKHKITIPVGLFLSTIRQAAVMTDSETYRVSFEFGKGKLRLTAKTAAGESDVEMPLEFDGKLATMYDPSLFKEMLSKLDSDSTIIYEQGDPQKPAKITQGDYLYLAVPMFVRE